MASKLTQNISKIEKTPTSMRHVFLIDWDDTGILKEIAVVKEGADGTIWGIEVDKLHPIDKTRLKRVLVSVHADKYALWELLAQAKLNNGTNALDFFHFNYVKAKRPKGAIIGGGLSSVSIAPEREIGVAPGGSVSEPVLTDMNASSSFN